MARVLFCRNLTGLKSHWLWYLEVNRSVTGYGKDIPPFLKRPRAIGTGHKLIGLAEFNRTT
jgi:hypothetical protein